MVAIDDDGAMRRVLARVLAWRGLTPLVAGTRDAGLELITSRRPSVVTLEYDVAGVSGLELADDIERALGRHAPPLVLVAAAADRIPRAERERFDAVHTKPFRASALLDDVERLALRAQRATSGVVAVHAADPKRRAENE